MEIEMTQWRMRSVRGRWRMLGMAAVSGLCCVGLMGMACGGTGLPPADSVAGSPPSAPVNQPIDSPDQPNEGNGPPAEPAPIDFTGSFTTAWTQEQVRLMTLDPTNTMPFVNVPTEKIMPGFWVWDSWPILERDGSLAVINGHYVIISLTAPDTILPGKRHDVATWRYMISADGRTWTDAGDVFPEGDALGSRQWAGSAIYEPDTNRVFFFYTAAGERGEEPFPENGLPDDDEENGDPENGDPNGDDPVNDDPNDDPVNGDPNNDNNNDDPVNDDENGEFIPEAGGGYYYTGPSGSLTYGQRMVQVTAFVVSDPQPVTFVGWGEHTIMVEPDLYWYEASEGFAGGFVFAWRDPYYFRDPRSGRSFITFTARSAGTVEFTGWNGVVGLAVADDEELTSWTLLPPLLDSLEVNNELERPHHLYIDDRYYMFFTSGSADRFDPSLADVEAIRPKGLYGFVADEFQGPYLPLNDSGLVLANPLAAPAQTYSYQVLPDGYVFFFINYVNTGADGIQDISDEWHMERFGGTLAPLLQIEIDGNDTRLIGWPKDVFELLEEIQQLPPPQPIGPINGPDNGENNGPPQPS